MNFFISIIGWALWNWAEFEIKKRELDEDGDEKTNYTFKDYTDKKWSSWIGSFLCIAVLMWVGHRQLSLDPFASLVGTHSLGWNDLYLLMSGAVWEIVLFAIKKIRSILKKKETEL